MPVFIITVCCTGCPRRFRTVPSVLEFNPHITCPNCGRQMAVSQPQPIATLTEKTSNPAA